MRRDLFLACLAMVASYIIDGLFVLALLSTLVFLPIVILYILGKIVGLIVFVLVCAFLIGMCKDILR